tara:strand:+ start:32 stop:466 length:435 start_codon:yes stop_codon:yes gene_type:complete
METRITELESQVRTLQAQIELIMKTVVGGKEVEKLEEKVNEYSLPNLTAKQHCTLQMLLNGKSNKEIAERFGVTTDTAKVHVRTIAKKLNVNSRSQIVSKTLEPMNAIDDNQYRIFTGGLPKDWDTSYESPDPFRGIYSKGGDE